MTAKAVKALVRMPPLGGIALLCLLLLLFLLPPLLLPEAAIAKDGPYLTWGAKNAPIQQAGNAAPVPVPPSPYGQVGDPYLHVLNWGTKSGAAQPSRPTPSPQVEPPQPTPVQAYSPPSQATAYHPAPQYNAQPRPQPVQSRPTPPAVRQPALAAQAPARPPVQAPVATPDDGAYQVPANSPYAARIAAARASQAKAEVKAAKPATASPSQVQQDQAAVTETPTNDDKPFVPGEHYTDASEAPRLYSLHRGYGLKPDPITIDNNASGAVLDTSHLDAAEARAQIKAMQEDKTSVDDDDDDDTRSVPAKPDAPSASGTQNASAGKTEKTAQ